ncbi:helix-turn-helix transcriptional regulator [Ruegeria marina]|uniref:Transcriptional regulator, AlpA family n=1 Tax=Ruegeria marina TaxID=639004 RepID=A0A1G6W7S1_9RHOB|nr:helix-turn-helix domain-containing protein [Ruegeria marina]SDD61990.1 transcriptional regulator, AlpA family [Ruegeria marina]
MRSHEDVLLNTKEAAKYLGLSPYTLEKWRSKGIGPGCVRIGSKAIRYWRSDLDAFILGGANG